MEQFIQNFVDLKNAGYPAIYVQTHEEDRFEETILEKTEFPVYSWDIIQGLVDLRENEIINKLGSIEEGILAAPNLEESSIFIIKDIHRFIDNVSTIRALKIAIEECKKSLITIVLLSPVVEIPVELEKDVVILEMPLPEVQEIASLAEKIVKENELNIEVREDLFNTAKGLTIDEAENAVSLSIIKNYEINPKVLEEQKMQTIKKSGLLEIYKPVDPSEIGGLENLKNYIENRKKGFTNPNLPAPKGILLLGIPGTGKSLSAKAISSILGFPLVKLDISALKDSLVGESERKMREALKIIDAVSPVVVWIDEIEKALSGVLSSSRTDGGTTSSMFGFLLTWMQESKNPKYIVATSNDIEELLMISQGALIRRFDDIFFVDLPNEEERKEILSIMNKKYETKIDLSLAEKMEGWTGAEIEKFVIASIYDGIEEAFKSIKPIYQQNKDVIEKSREWARANARIANKQIRKARKEIKRKLTV